MCALQSKYTNKSKQLAVYLIVNLRGDSMHQGARAGSRRAAWDRGVDG